MDNRKFEQLIELIINENEEQARSLFHDIVVEKSREIYESMMDEEMTDSPVDGLLDEIGVEEQGMVEDDGEFDDIEVDGEEGDMEFDLDADEMGDEDEMGEEELEDRVVDLEDKLDELMAEFEQLMGQEEGSEEDEMGDMGGEEDFGAEDEMMEAEDEDEDGNTLEEAVQLQKVSVTHGDNGQQTKSPVSGGPKVPGMGAKAVSMGGGDGGKGGTQGGLLNPATKDLKGAGQFKNAPGNKNVDPTAAPKPKHGDDGQNTRSITSESKRVTKKILKK
jgi:hypothetical protein